MPLYDFECKKCSVVYEALCDYDEKNKYPTVSCPKCKSKRKTRVFTRCNVLIKGCAPSSPDIAFGRKYEQAQEDRRKAEEASHMGESVYNQIDDLNSSEDYFGEVK